MEFVANVIKLTSSKTHNNAKNIGKIYLFKEGQLNAPLIASRHELMKRDLKVVGSQLGKQQIVTNCHKVTEECE